MPYRNRPDDGAPILVVAIGRFVVGVDPGSGAERWRHEVEGLGRFRVEVSGDRVFALGSQVLRAFTYPDGVPLWHHDVGYQTDTLFIDGGRIFVAGNGEVRAFGWGGELLWHAPFKGMGLHGPALAVPGRSAQIDRQR